MPADVSNSKKKMVVLDRAQKRGGAAIAAVRQYGSAGRFGSRDRDRILGKWRGLSRDEGGKAFPGHGNPRDEGVARLKRELTQVKHERIYRRRYRTHQEARTDVFESIEVRHNAERRAQLGGSTLIKPSVETG